MKITNLRTAHLGGSSGCVKIETDAGVSGVGEPVVESLPEPTLKVVEKLGEEYLIGKDPRPIERHRRVIQDGLWYHQGPVAHGAWAGIEHALWDIKARALDVPVYELLGGPVRESVRTYKWIGADTRENLPEQARDRVVEGFDAMKFSPTPNDPSSYPRVVKEARRIVGEVRDAVGPDVDLLLDPASRWKLPEAKHILSELEEFNPLFAEDFVSPGEISVVEKLADHTHVPYALGDRVTGLGEFEEIIQRDAAAVLQPDICHSTGLTGIKHIAGFAEIHGMRIAPHNPQGPIATAAAVHLDFSIPNFLIQEVAGTDFFGAWDASPYIDAESITIEDGHVPLPEKPGLGVSVDDEVFDSSTRFSKAPMFFDRTDFHVPEW